MPSHEQRARLDKVPQPYRDELATFIELGKVPTLLLLLHIVAGRVRAAITILGDKPSPIAAILDVLEQDCPDIAWGDVGFVAHWEDKGGLKGK